MSSDDRQRIVRVPGSRRVQLTPAPGTAAEPVPADATDEETDAAPGAARGAAAPGTSGPNDDRLRQDVPPHY